MLPTSDLPVAGTFVSEPVQTQHLPQYLITITGSTQDGWVGKVTEPQLGITDFVTEPEATLDGALTLCRAYITP